MRIAQSYETQFADFLLDMKDKYPKSIVDLEGISDEALDITKFSRNYFLKSKNVADASVDANANVQMRCVATYKSEVHKGLDKLNSLYLLWKTARKHWSTREANRLLEEEINKDLNIQDAQHAYLPYCFAFDAYDLLNSGLPFVQNYPSKPAKHSDVLLQHTIQLIQVAASELMGATAIPNILVIYSAVLKRDSRDPNYPIPNYLEDPILFRRYFEQRMQELIFLLNQPIRQAQSAFSNVTIFDSIFLKELCKMYVIEDETIDPEFAMFIQREFLKICNKMNELQIATFPVLTAQFKKDSDGNIEDQEFLDFISDINLPYGHINIFSAENLTALSSCCRLVNNVEDIIKAAQEENMNLIGGSSIKVGSFGVTTVNLARIGLYANGDRSVFMSRLDDLARDAYKLNHCRRQLIMNMIDHSQLFMYKYGFIDLKNQYSTLGIVGLYEAIHFMGHDILSESGQALAIEILETLTKLSEEAVKTYGYRCNIEQIPAEQTAIKLAETDNILYGQNEFKLYANQFIPLTNETDILNRIHLQATFEKYFSGGTILHVNLGQKISSKEVMKKLISFIVKTGVQYFAINYFFQECADKHLTIGDDTVCPVCGKEIVERYTRIVGFIRPVSSWSKERREEFTNRKKYTEISV